MRLPDRREVLVSDTVGFIDRLPHTLVAAFRGTLEEVRDADALLHVIDASAEDRDRRVAAVRTVLKDVGAEDVPCVDVYNKADKLADGRTTPPGGGLPGRGDRLRAARQGRRRTARTRRGHARASTRAGSRLRCDPDSDAGRRGMAWVYRHGRVVRHVNRGGRAHIDAEVPRREFAAFRKRMAEAPLAALSMSDV